MPPLDLLATPPRVVHANRYPFRAGEVAGPHASESELVLPVLSGVGTIEVAGRLFAPRPGQVVHVPWGATVRYAADRARPFAVIGVHLAFRAWSAPAEARPPRHEGRGEDAPPSTLRRPDGGTLADEPFALPADADPRIVELATRIVDVFEARAADVECETRALAVAFVIALRRARDAAAVQAAHPHAARVREAAAWLQRSYARPVRRAELARRAGLSETALASAFRAVLGRAPIDWLIDLRLAKARERLRATRDPVAAVGAAVGIADPYYFARVFRRRVGCSPREYRRRHRF